MNYRVITSAVLATSLSAFAGQAYFIFKKDSTYSAGLLGLDSVTFPKDRRGTSDSLFIEGFGLKGFDRIPLRKTEISFRTNYFDAEKMSIDVDAGARPMDYSFYLRDVEYIDFIEMDNNKDTDKDGISDVDEMFKIGTNPLSEDTDGDGTDDGAEMKVFNPNNPAVWNPHVADLPKLEVTMTMTPSIALQRTTSTGSSKSTTISEGETLQTAESVSNAETRSASLMNGWNVGVTAGIQKDDPTFLVNVGYHGSFTQSEGHTLTESQSKTITSNYTKAVAEAMTQGETISGGSISMQAKVTNTGKVAYSIDNLVLNASTYTPSGDIKIIAELAVGDGAGESNWTQITLAPGESRELKFWKSGVSLDALSSLIYNPGAIFLSASAYKITAKEDGKDTDFTGAYTRASASTARITIDKGVYYSNHEDQVNEYLVATNFRHNRSYRGMDDYYKPVSLSDMLRVLRMPFEQDSIEVGNEVRYGLKSVGDLSFAAADGDTACWFVSVSKAANPNVAKLYSVQIGSFNLDSVTVAAGDRVQFIYNEDRDHDHVPASMEKMLGISDNKADTDGDSISDFDEINGWTKMVYTYVPLAVPTAVNRNCRNDNFMHLKYDSTRSFCFAPDKDGKYNIPVACAELVTTYENYCYNTAGIVKIKEIHPKDVFGYDTVQVAIDSALIGPFFTNPAQKDTDGDGIDDYEDSNPNVRVASDNSALANVVVNDVAEMKNVAVSRNCMTDDMVCGDTLFVTDTIRGATAEVTITTVDPVNVDGGVKAFRGNTRIPVTVEGAKESGHGIEAKMFKISVENLSPADADTIRFVVTSESGDSTAYHLALRSAITAPTDMSLGRNSDRNALMLSWIPKKADKRVLGYVVLRAKGNKGVDNADLASYVMKPTTTKPQDDYSLDNGITMVKVLGPNDDSYTDKVGGGSPYYTYRVYAYAKSGNKYVFSPGSNVQTKSVGRIKFEFQLTGRGSEYLWNYGKARREDFITDAIFYEGSNTGVPPLHQYTYYFRDAGSVGAGNTVVYENKTDTDMDHDDNKVSGDDTRYSFEIGNGGITMQLKVAARYGDKPSHNVFWPYENLARVLNGSTDVTVDAKNRNAPKSNWSEHKFNYGMSGIEFDPGDNGCDRDCGDEPHAGYKFKFNYRWAD